MSRLLEEHIAFMEDRMVEFVRAMHAGAFNPEEPIAANELESIFQEVERIVLRYQAGVREGTIQNTPTGERISRRVQGLITGLNEVKTNFTNVIVKEYNNMVRTRRQAAAAAAAAAAPAPVAAPGPASRFSRLRGLISKRLKKTHARQYKCRMAGYMLKKGRESERKRASQTMLQCKREKRSGRLVWM